MAVKDLEVKATPTPPTPYSKDDAYQLELMKSMLDEAGTTVGLNKGPTAAKETEAYTKLHNSIRNLFLLRGDAFIAGFRLFVEAATVHAKGIFYDTYRNRKQDLILDRAEREAFMIFLNMLGRFAKSQDKASFPLVNNVERLASRFDDAELQHLIRVVFLAA